MSLMIHSRAPAGPFQVLKDVEPVKKCGSPKDFFSFFFTFYFLISSLCSSKWAFFFLSMISFYLSSRKRGGWERLSHLNQLCSLWMLPFSSFRETCQTSFPWCIWLVCVHITYLVTGDFPHPAKLIFLSQISAWCTLGRENPLEHQDLPLTVGGFGCLP